MYIAKQHGLRWELKILQEQLYNVEIGSPCYQATTSSPKIWTLEYGR
jgi:hypothetical protein